MKKLLIVGAVLLTIAALIYVVFGGSPKETQKIDPAFTGYVSGFTSGIISKETEIVVHLREEVALEKQTEEVAEDLFDFDPNIEGEAYWKDSYTVAFKPTEYLTSGMLYGAEFDLSELMEVPKDLEVLAFQFQTIKQAVEVYFDGMEAYDDQDLKWQKIKGSINTADVALSSEIEELFKASQNNNELSLTWEHGENNKWHTFVIDSVSRTEDKGEVNLTWEAKNIGAEENGEMDIEIPALGDFKVMNVRVYQQPNQYVSVRFSDPLKRTQDLEGLIYFASGEEVRLEINRNEVKVYPENRITGVAKLVVTDGIRNTLNYQMQNEFSKELAFFDTKPAIEVIGDGVILPSTNGLIFPFKAVNLSAVNVKIVKVYEDNMAQFFQVNQFDGSREMKRVGRIVYKEEVILKSDKPIDYGSWNTFSLDLSEIIEVDPGALYRVNISFSKKHSLYPCGEKESEADFEYKGEDREDARYDGPSSNYYDDYYDDEYYDYNNDYVWKERDNPCKKSYYVNNNRGIVRNVFASDLGIIAKGGSTNEITVAITDLKSTESLSGVEIELYNYQQQVIAKGVTNSDGFATIKVGKKPFLLVAKQGAQKGYLRLDDGESLSTSMFNVSGQAAKKGVKGFIYGERGVWRPGDSLFVAFMLEDKNNAIPATHPVVMELYTPENKLFLRKVKTNSVNGLYDFRMKTDPESPTGNWFAKIKVGGSTFTKTIKIEAIKPNRLKINLDFGSEILRSSNKTGELSVKWLHGATAKGLKADIEMTLVKGSTQFKGFDGFSFDDPSKEFESEEQNVFEGRLNQEGIATVYPKIKVKKNAPGMLKAQFKTRAFEAGGDFSIDSYVMKYSPYDGYVGLKIPEGEGWNAALFSNEKNLINIATVDEEGNPVNRSNVKIEIYDVRWRWWWERSHDYDLANYVSSRSNNKIKTDYVDTKNGKAIYELNVGDEYWGRRFIRVTDPVTGHSSGQVVYFSYKGWWNNSSGGPGGAEMLTFTTDKDKYNVGEEVKVELPEGKVGRALVSLESGSRVINTRWVELSDGNEFTFEATPDMAPNVFVNISLIQPHSQTENNLPIRLYGIQSIEVEDPETHLEPVIDMPDVLVPEEDVEIEVSEKNGKNMTFTIAVVDDGLLDLTRFKTPAPWKHFYAKEALNIKTWDMYKYVVGAFSGEMAGLLALGGDEFLNNAGAKKANRFKPVVKYFGPFELKGGDEKTIKFKMPNYIGSLRTMVVAGQDGAYGSAEKTTAVKKPLMVLATLPRVLGPTEKVKLPVTVFSMSKKIKNVKVTLETNEMLKINGSKSKTITFTEEGDQIVEFDIDVAKKIGMATAKVTVSGGGEKATYEMELDVRMPNPLVNKITGGMAEKGKTWKTDYTPLGILGTREGVLEVSSIPSMGLENRLKYLIHYPYGCVEQTTSSVFPQLYLTSLIDMSDEKKEAIETNIKNGIKRLKTFQTASGGLSYWPGEYYDSEWGTNYAGHFMIEAKNKGYKLPVGFLNNWIKFQKKNANDWVPTKSKYYYHSRRDGEMLQAYRLYTLALAKKPALGAMNRMRGMKGLHSLTKWRLAAAYLLAGKSKVANAIITDLTSTVEAYNKFSYTYGSVERDQAMILETMVLMKKKSEAFTILKELSEKMTSQRWMSTQTTAYCLLAAAKFIGADDATSEIEYALTINGKTENVSSDEKPIMKHAVQVNGITNGTISLKNKGETPLFINLVLTGIPLMGNETLAQNSLNVKVAYLDMDGSKIDPTSLEQGTDFMAEVSIAHPGLRGDYKEMVLDQIFPSGWEIRNIRMDEIQTIKIKDKPRYEDIRDDRVYSFFDLSKYKKRTFRVLLNASYQGRFYLPSVKCGAMYDNTIESLIPGKWVEVTGAE
ncbi:MAG: alpha-2-macroglobulin family protein [Vicingaceae bacterium]|nr:alpha-2-macroglobulin family protein [Vicingaceae bacterium]